MRRRVTILGCGSSGGVPRADGDWGACDPADPRNRRTRCGLLVQQWRDGAEAPTTVLIDTSPDLREQLLTAQVNRIDAVIYTHDHADQTHGIDDLRAIVYAQRKRIPAYFNAATDAALRPRFRYIFEGAPSYPALIEPHVTLAPGAETIIDGAGGPIAFLALDQDHGLGNRSLGFRFGDAAYCNDVVDLPEETLAQLEGLDLFIVDALRFTPHPTHAHVDKALSWAARVRPARTVLTNLHVDLDYEKLASQLPAAVEPAVDGWAWETEVG
jgi:phosphoribosyl 1,2-cyclic phosphate phosphodiesterase